MQFLNLSANFVAPFNKLNGDDFVDFCSFLDGILFYFLFLRSRKLIKPAVKSCCLSYRLFTVFHCSFSHKGIKAGNVPRLIEHRLNIPRFGALIRTTAVNKTISQFLERNFQECITC